MNNWLKKAWLVFRLDMFRNRHLLVLMIDVLLCWPVLCLIMLKIRMLPWGSVQLLLEANDVVLLAAGCALTYRLFNDAHEERLMVNSQRLPASAGQQVAAKWLTGFVVCYALWAIFGVLYGNVASEILVPLMRLQISNWTVATPMQVVDSSWRSAVSEAAFFALWQALFFYCSVRFSEQRFLRMFMVAFFGYIVFVQTIYLGARWFLLGYSVFNVEVQYGGMRLLAQILNPFIYFPQLGILWVAIQFATAIALWLAAARRLRRTVI